MKTCLHHTRVLRLKTVIKNGRRNAKKSKHFMSHKHIFKLNDETRKNNNIFFI